MEHLHSVRRGRRSLCLLMVALLSAPVLPAQRPLSQAEKYHLKIVKHGLDARLWLKEKNGLEFTGRVQSIGDQGFELQIFDDPQLEPIRYDEIQNLRIAPGYKAVVLWSLIGVGGITATSLIAMHSMQQHALSPPSTPPQPTIP